MCIPKLFPLYCKYYSCCCCCCCLQLPLLRFVSQMRKARLQLQAELRHSHYMIVMIDNSELIMMPDLLPLLRLHVIAWLGIKGVLQLAD